MFASRHSLLSAVLFSAWATLASADITWSHFSTNVDCDTNLYTTATFATALTTAWDAVKDGKLAVYMLRMKAAPTGDQKDTIEGEFETELKEFVPPDLFFFYASKATATDMRTRKDAFGIDAVDATPAAVKVLKALAQAQQQSQSNTAEQPEVTIELSPGSKANEQETEKLAAVWEGAVHGATAGSKAKFKGTAADVITLSGVKGNEMKTALDIVASQPEAMVLQQSPNFTEVEPVVPGTPTDVTGGRRLNDQANDITQSGTIGEEPLWQAGLTGTGEIVGIADSGLYDPSCFFNGNANLPRNQEADLSQRKVVNYIAFADGQAGEPNDHGTHVAGSVAGQCTVAGGQIYDGMARAAKIHFFDIGVAGERGLRVPNNLATGLFPAAKEAGAAIHTNSWGANTNAYTTSSRDVDRYSYDNPEFVVLIAAGNSGPNTNTVGSPATAKNCISVGASVNQKTGSIENMAGFSSRGPCADGRICIDVVAPGHSVTSAASERPCSVTSMSGTSMATPVTAGSVALVRQYFREGWYPSGTKTAADAFTPSGALLKAMIIQSGKQMTGTGVGTFPGTSQGFGRVDLDSVLKLGTRPADRGTLWVRSTKIGTNDKAELSTGQTFEKTFTLNANGKFKASLVWMDPPSAVNANRNLVNNLDLKVTGGGVTTHANGLTTPDTLNSVEMVEITGTAGVTYTVTVTGTSVTQGGVQPYALVVTGPFSATNTPSPPAPPATTTTVTTVPGQTPAPPAPTTTVTAVAPGPTPAPTYVKINPLTCGAACTCASINMAAIRDRGSCEAAAKALQLTDVTARYVGSVPRPDGCYQLNNNLYAAYNPRNYGNGVVGPREPICKPKSTYYQKISTGSCAAQGLAVIKDSETCEAAALDLGMLDTTAFSTRSANRPEGCYYKDDIPGFALFLSTNAANVGNGGTTVREQICQVINPTTQSGGGGNFGVVAAGAVQAGFHMVTAVLALMMGSILSA